MILPGGISVYCILITYISRDKLCSTLSKMLNWLMHLSKEADPVTMPIHAQSLWIHLYGKKTTWNKCIVILPRQNHNWYMHLSANRPGCSAHPPPFSFVPLSPSLAAVLGPKAYSSRSPWLPSL